MPSFPATWGSITRRIEVQICLGIKEDPISKITKTKSAVVWFK
jgi:hypothetical protein